MFEHSYPDDIIWDLTYACPLRCEYCYSESGRRETKQPSFDKLMQIAEVIRKIKPRRVAFSGGEPLLVKKVFEAASLLKREGIHVSLFTTGYPVSKKNIQAIQESFSQVHISLDAPSQEVNDANRGKRGAFEKALSALHICNTYAAERNKERLSRFKFGIDCVVVKKNFSFIQQMCTEIASQFSELDFLNIGAAIPSGLANRASFSDVQLLDEKQLSILRSPSFYAQLQALVSEKVKENLTVSDNFCLQMHPDDLENGEARSNAIQIEPDGSVRGSLIYEGTVGNVLEDAIEVLLQRVHERSVDPFFVETLSKVKTMRDWAKAARMIDEKFASKENKIRIFSRKEYVNSQ